jgi:hypothetical protein
METIFKNKAKNSKQIKTKDQNIKNKYFFKTNKKLYFVEFWILFVVSV